MSRQRRKHSLIKRLLIIAVCAYLLYGLGSLQVELISQNKQEASLLRERDIKAQRVSELKCLLENGTEADIVEKAARERLGYVFADEKVYIDISGN